MDDEVFGSYIVVRAHYIGADKEHSWWLLQAGECQSVMPGTTREGRDAFDAFTRRIGEEVRVSRHFSDGHREFWDAMDAALPTLGVRHFSEEERPVWPRPGWREDGHFGFQAHVKEVSCAG